MLVKLTVTTGLLKVWPLNIAKIAIIRLAQKAIYKSKYGGGGGWFKGFKSGSKRQTVWLCSQEFIVYKQPCGFTATLRLQKKRGNRETVGYLKCVNGKVSHQIAPGDLLFRNLHWKTIQISLVRKPGKTGNFIRFYCKV